nr:hypothetical protein [Tanacetum cinerariifolium]
MLLMALPNEHLMTFNQYKDAKSLFDAITIRFGGNDATRKTGKTLLKQMYENFSAQRTESLDSIFNRLQKIVSQRAVLGKSISQEDLNLNFLRILPSEWNTHVVVWRNKSDLDKISIDDLYNNFKIIEQEVKRNADTSLSSGSQNTAFVSTPSTSNNDDVSTVFRVSTASPQVSTANLSDVTMYNVVLPPHTGRFLPPRIDLSHTGLPEFAEPSVESYGVKPIKVVTKTSSVKISEHVKENNDAPLIEDWESEGEDEDEYPHEIERKIIEPSVDKVEARCKYHQRKKMVNETNHSRVNHSVNKVPKAVLTRTDLKPVNTVRPVNPKSTRRKSRTRTRRMGIRIPQSNVPSSVTDEAITKEMHDGLGRAITTSSSLEAEQGIGNISKTQTKATPYGPSSPRTSSEGGPGCHVTIGVVMFRLGLKGYLTCPMSNHSEKVTHLEVGRASSKDDDEITLAETLVNIKKSAAKDKVESEGQIPDSKAGERSSKEGESLKRPAEEELGQEQQKKQKVKKDLSQERLQQMMVIIHEQGIHVEALWTKFGEIMELVKERFSSSNPTEDKEITLWVELKRQFEPHEDDELWKFKSFELIRRLYDWCGVHHISTRDGYDIFMLVEKEYPLSRGALLMMLVQRLQVDEHNEMAEELLKKIFMQAERLRK